MNLPEYIFSDFDGTISKKDVIDAFIKNFSKGDWTISEEKWARGEISTAECLRIQFDLITGLKKSVFDEFLNSIEIDPYFVEFYKMIQLKGSKLMILSDGYDVFIEAALKKYGLDIPVYANKLMIGEKEGFVTFDMEYPNSYKKCKIGAGCCKCAMAQKYTDNFMYIGDGLSDRCIAKKSSLLYAKLGLETFCKQQNIPHIPFKTFKDIIDSLCTREVDKYYAAGNDKNFNGK